MATAPLFANRWGLAATGTPARCTSWLQVDRNTKRAAGTERALQACDASPSARSAFASLQHLILGALLTVPVCLPVSAVSLMVRFPDLTWLPDTCTRHQGLQKPMFGG